jgi:hypothetical protein
VPYLSDIAAGKRASGPFGQQIFPAWPLGAAAGDRESAVGFGGDLRYASDASPYRLVTFSPWAATGEVTRMTLEMPLSGVDIDRPSTTISYIPTNA